MGDHMEDEVDTISLSGLQFEDDEEVSKTNLSSSSSSSSFEQDFLGFFSEEWSRDPSYNTSPENIIFCGKIVSSKPSVSQVRKPAEVNRRTSALFRSTSDSFRFMYTASRESTPRSKSLPKRLSSTSSLSSSCKSKWQVFVFGFGSGKFPTTMDMSNIKSRQRLPRQSPVKVGERKEESDGRRSAEGWWRVVNVLGCNGGFERDTL